MRRTAVALMLAALQGCAATAPPITPARDCPELPALPVNPTIAQRGQHTEAIVALYLRCAGVNH